MLADFRAGNGICFLKKKAKIIEGSGGGELRCFFLGGGGGGGGGEEFEKRGFMENNLKIKIS